MLLPSILQNRLSMPVVGLPLFITSNLDLVITQCRVDMVDSFPALSAWLVGLPKTWLQRTTMKLAEYGAQYPNKPSAPFTVSQIMHKSNDRLEHDLELCVKYKVPIVIMLLGACGDVSQAVYSYGGIMLRDVINNKFTKKATEKGVDGLIVVAADAGGHAGTTSPSVLIHEIHEWFDGLLLLLDAIVNGNAILAVLAASAGLACVGSAFIATREANVTEGYRQTTIESIASDIVYTNLFAGVHSNYLRRSIEGVGLNPDTLSESDPSKMNFGLGSGAKAKTWEDIWGAGQDVGAVRHVVPAVELIKHFAEEFEVACRYLNNIEALRTAADSRVTA